MKQDAEASMIAFYILRGIPLTELLQADAAEKKIYMAAMELEIETKEEILKSMQR